MEATTLASPLRLRFRTDASDERRLRDASFRYRVITRLPLSASGVPGFCEVIPAADVADDDEGIDVVIWQRPGDPARVERLRKRSRARIWVADLDDLLFASPESSPAALTRRSTVADAIKACQRYRDALAQFTHVIVSTEPLAEAVRAEFPRATVGWVPNGVPANWLNHGRIVYPRWKPGDERVVRYLPGTSSHDADFTVACAALERLLAARRDIIFEVVGPLRFPIERFPGGRVRHLPPVPYEHLPQYLAGSWATIAPLEDNAFNRCKSSIKFMESAAFGCPCVASPIPDMRRHVDGGIQLASTPLEWSARLEALLDDAFRMEVAGRSEAHIDAACTQAVSTRAMGDHLRSWLPA